jgi:hypothetical protein
MRFSSRSNAIVTVASGKVPVLQTRARFEALTRREQEVFGLVTAGLMNKQVAGTWGQRNHCEGASRQRYAEDGRPFVSRLGADGRCTGYSAAKH